VKCICIKDFTASGNTNNPWALLFVKGSHYKYHHSASDNYQVLLYPGFIQQMDPLSFKSHFIKLKEYRDIQLNEILDNGK
jgi:hypothetical protein